MGSCPDTDIDPSYSTGNISFMLLSNLTSYEWPVIYTVVNRR